MKGYKVLDKNMCSFTAKMQYELNKEYSIEEEISLGGDKGFHFCESLIEAIKWIPDTKNNHVFEIDTLDGEVIRGLYTNVSNKIKIVRKLTFKEIANGLVKDILNNK